MAMPPKATSRLPIRFGCDERVDPASFMGFDTAAIADLTTKVKAVYDERAPGEVTLIDFDEPDFGLLRHFDWTGFFAMAGFLGALQYILEEGPRNDWFDDRAVLAFAVISAVSAVAFFWRVLTTQYPIVDLKAVLDPIRER